MVVLVSPRVTGTAGNDIMRPDFLSPGVSTADGDANGYVAYLGLAGDDEIVVGGLFSNPFGNVSGGDGNDTVTGSSGRDFLNGDAGDDLIRGGDGDDAISGNDGDDTLDGGQGNDDMSGGAGNDTCFVDSAGDRVIENPQDPGYDTVFVTAASWSVTSAVEVVRLLDTAQTVQGGAWADQIVARVSGGSAVFGMGGNDTLWAGSNPDTLDGGDGDDVLIGGLAAGRMVGGAGNDQYIINHTGAVVVEQADGGIDTAWVAVDGYTMAANLEIARLTGSAIRITGSTANDVMVANPAAGGVLDGGAGDDQLWGSVAAEIYICGDGNDVVRGGGGADTIFGGAGDDQFVLPNNFTTITELAGGGTDTVWVTADGYTLAANIEIGRLGGAAIRLTGSAGDDQLVANPVAGGILDGGAGDDVLWGSALAETFLGNAGDDIIRGGGGADVMAGGAGNDQYVILDANATITENAGEGDDTAWVAVNNYLVGANVERINLSGTANTALGNAADNIIAGNPTMGNALLAGGAGRDVIFGSGFADVFRGDAGDDTLYSLGGADRFLYAAQGWGVDQINGFVQGAARLDFTGSGIGFQQLALSFGNGNTQVTLGADIILVFGATLVQGDFIF
jgi:Ca2+-binding RTX toxin-like protein